MPQADSKPRLLLLILVSAVALALPAAGQETVQYSCGTTVTYRFFSGVSQQQQALIRQATQSSIEFLCRKTGYGTPPFQVGASPNAEELIAIGMALGYPRESFDGLSCAVSPLGAILLNSSNEGCWTWTRPDAATRVLKILAHEYFHQVQRRLTNQSTWAESVDADRVPTKGPAWLIEGAAELVGWLAVDDAGLRALPVTLDTMFTPSLRTSALPLVGQQPIWNPPASANDPYSFVAEATNQLTSTAPAKLLWLMSFWDSIGKGALWRAAFQNTFGRSIGVFYNEFDHYVQSLAGTPFSLSYRGAYAPIDPSYPGCVPHLFWLTGFDLFSPGVDWRSGLQLPAGQCGHAPDPLTRGLIVYMYGTATSGTYTVGLRLPDGRTASTSFTHTQTAGMSSSAPEISGFSPASLAQGTPGLKLTVIGRNFIPGTTITGNGSTVPALVKSATELDITVSGLLLRAPFIIQAMNPPPGGGVSRSVQAPVVDAGVIRIEPTSVSVPPLGGAGSITITTATPNVFWAVSGEPPWLFLDGPRKGSGNANLSYRVAASPERTSRSATLNIGGRTFMLTQPSGSPDAPQIRAGGVGNAAYPPIASAADSFLSIFGNSFTDQTLTWDRLIGADASLPTRLGDVQVRIGDRDCYLHFVSPTQINVLAPPGLAAGNSLVEVVTPRGTALASVEIMHSSPAFFTYLINEKSYIAATFANEATLVAPSGAVAGRLSRPARPGDYLSLYANGLGPTAVPHPAGQVLTSYYELANSSAVRVTIAGIPARVLFAGMTMAGVFQVNIQAPANVPEGESLVVLEVDGKTTQLNVLLIFSR